MILDKKATNDILNLIRWVLCYFQTRYLLQKKSHVTDDDVINQSISLTMIKNWTKQQTKQIKIPRKTSILCFGESWSVNSDGYRKNHIHRCIQVQILKCQMFPRKFCWQSQNFKRKFHVTVEKCLKKRLPKNRKKKQTNIHAAKNTTSKWRNAPTRLAIRVSFRIGRQYCSHQFAIDLVCGLWTCDHV